MSCESVYYLAFPVRIEEHFLRTCLVLFSSFSHVSRNISKSHDFWLAKPYGLANKKSCYLQIYKISTKKTKNVSENKKKKNLAENGQTSRTVDEAIQF